jgi:hypothetical protein
MYDRGVMVRDEPGYGDQVPRRMKYQAAHPETEILYLAGWWQAVIHEGGDGLVVITRPSLEKLLNKLESL